jgi:hypothetical protein
MIRFLLGLVFRGQSEPNVVAGASCTNFIFLNE